jgi:hypothetical protein
LFVTKAERQRKRQRERERRNMKHGMTKNIETLIRYNYYQI